jgi:O-antigen ligase
MSKHKTASFSPDVLDSGIRFFLYIFIFWLPYSKAVVETCVILALLLWIIKRIWLWHQGKSGARHLWFWYLQPESTGLNQSIVFFLLACLLSSLSSFFWDRALRGFITKTCEWFVIYFLVVEAFKEKKHIYVALSVFIFTAMATSFDSICQYHWGHPDIFFGYPLTIDHRATAGFTHPNSLGGFLTVVIPLLLGGSLIKGKSSGWKFVPVFFIIAVWSLVLTFSRASWLGVIIGVLFFAFFAWNKRFLRVVLIFCLLAVLIGPFFLNSPQLREEFRLSDKNVSVTTGWRWQVWKDSLEMIKEKPLLGHGINTFMPLFQEYRSNISGQAGDIWTPTYAHNTFLQLLTETGILGFAMFLWILKNIFGSSLLTIEQTRERDLKMWLLGSLAGSLAFLVQSLADNNFYSLQLSSLFWLNVGLSFAMVKLLSKDDSCGIKNVHN